ncbi:MAG: hypothetical protein AVDCRST_MAG25-1889 [uncultured Rubrobacteraceae bacterium]|uniref:Uncharacterized protein n=1 Tax=uncultured Rubrobacteraceae bacterium TaxID=349277 RepID=A0A6J4RB53_9ACTN|nr:MAG: hypothetical protein AVDCRST_MAG25-1889 [uncultured Rubrobacteraceae bacterium]
MGTDVAYEAFRRYLRRPGASPGNLLRLAKQLRTERLMSNALTMLMDKLGGGQSLRPCMLCITLHVEARYGG